MKANFLKLAGVKSEGEFYNKFPTEEAFFKKFPQAKEMAYGGSMMRKKPTEYPGGGMLMPQGRITQMGSGGYKVTRSSDRKGKTHKVTGPDGSVKFFGDPNLKNRPNNPAAKKSWYARHKQSLDKNPHFRAYARSTWGYGGKMDEYAYGGKKKKEDDYAYGGDMDYAYGGDMDYGYGGNMKEYAKGGYDNPGFKSLPANVQNKIMKNSMKNGGMMDYQMGGQLTEFQGGGTHQENPNGGIPQGPDASVEEGETKMDAANYIFSDRLTVPKDLSKELQMPFLKGKTFASASKAIKKKYDPQGKKETDLIVQNAIERELKKLIAMQEVHKADLIVGHQKEIADLQGNASPTDQMMPPQEMQMQGAPQGMPQQMQQMQQMPQEGMQMGYGGMRKQMQAGGENPTQPSTFSNFRAAVENTPITSAITAGQGMATVASGIGYRRELEGMKPVAKDPAMFNLEQEDLEYNPIDSAPYLAMLDQEAAQAQNQIMDVAGKSPGTTLANIGNLAERIGRAKATTEQDLRMRNETLKQQTYGLNLRKGMFDKQMEAQVTDWNDQDLNAFQSALLNYKSTQGQNVSTSLTNLRREQTAKDLESGQVGTLGDFSKKKVKSNPPPPPSKVEGLDDLSAGENSIVSNNLGLRPMEVTRPSMEEPPDPQLNIENIGQNVTNNETGGTELFASLDAYKDYMDAKQAAEDAIPTSPTAPGSIQGSGTEVGNTSDTYDIAQTNLTSIPQSTAQPTAQPTEEATEMRVVTDPLSNNPLAKENLGVSYNNPEYVDEFSGKTRAEMKAIVEGTHKQYKKTQERLETFRGDAVGKDGRQIEITNVKKGKLTLLSRPDMDFVDVNVGFENLAGRVDGNGLSSTPQPPELIEDYFYGDKEIPDAGTYAKTNIPKVGLAAIFPEEDQKTPQYEMLAMFNLNTGWHPKVLAGVAAGDIKRKNRGEYWKTPDKVNDVTLSDIDPQKLLNEMDDVYRNTYDDKEDSKAGYLPEQYGSYRERVVLLANRYGLEVPK